MKYLYSSATRFKDQSLISEINEAAFRLATKLSSIDLLSIGLSEYNANYLMNNFKNPISTIQQNAHLLALCLQDRNVDKGNFVIVDYGGGSGLFSLLAKEFGIGCVVYIDIYDVSCQDIKKLAKALDLTIDGNLCGELEDLIVFLETKNLSTDAVCSFDVIEHIYDMEGFLKECKDIPGKNLRLILGSGANERNPIIKRVLQKGHYSFENTDRPNVFGHKQRDSLLSFLKIRQDIIFAYNPKLDIESIKMLALGTRGLRKEDVFACVDEFGKMGKLNYVPNHPTNTCDPLTGNWNEQLMDPLWLKSILETQGFAVRVLPGFWGDGVVFYKTCFKIMLNMMIKYSGAFALTFAPYYVIYADRNDHLNKL